MYKVLVAGRDESDLNGIRWLLHSAMTSWQVETVNLPGELIGKIETFRPDLLIIELEMIEDEAHYHFIVNVLNIVKPSICAITIEPTFARAKNAIDLGVNDLLLKPISPEILLKSVQRIYRKNHADKKNLPANQIQSERSIGYTHLFLNSDEPIRPLKSFGLKSESVHILPELYQFLKSYQWKRPLFSFVLTEMIVCFAASHDDINWRQEWSRFLRDWQTMSHEPIVIVAQDSNGNEPIKDQYHLLKHRMEISFYIGFNQIIDNRSDRDWRMIDPFLTPEDQQLWVELLAQSDLKGLKKWLYDEFLNLNPPYPDPAIIRIRLTSILAQIRRFMLSNKLENPSFEKNYLQLFQEILYCPVIYRIIEELILFIGQLIENVITRKNPIQLSKKVFHYLEENYANPQLNLTEIGEKFNKNASYISYVISNNYHKTFRGILTDIRIRHAIDLLEESSLSIKEISSQCGFSNQQYFNKVFLKKMNCSPSQFRKKIEL
ncbi:two-component system, response regulator YesN [Cytobacillus horneckiae]|uniref:AraC family transcriptional regulator n=1 Tax=Cytobacillus horneckiae TaxID=549687 RepID=A0A2N0ZI22_9BACI|nr:helix-turn-helix domain-containing protein [Cytobacillus horneckiae]MBN6886881.1 DNA-binding response regulator [Cytobacillus horneckiae]MCM3177650.1 DNA-binding response regulator [Cytobacillus horneckiae]MEC1157956.1 DNA-binding response regulator [Cytobacillus horneckiae]MED2937119.1 DNA-binding response regulator [Cytobacillus horneckiae]PKG29136.1 AraC family transcriptional regulator [Cytobacillus horneckiae]